MSLSEFKTTLRILKTRWREVSLIMGIHLVQSAVRLTFSTLFAKELLAKSRAFGLLGLSIAWFLVAILILIWTGFLRTVYLEGEMRQSPRVLVRLGVGFFWRMVVVSLVIGVAVVMVGGLCSAVVIFLLDLDGSANWVAVVMGVLISLGLIKFILFIPALIIVLDCSVVVGFTWLKRLRLSEAKGLVIVYCVHVGVDLVRVLLRHAFTGTWGHVLNIGFSLAAGFIRLIVSVMAVRFMGTYAETYGKRREN